MNIMLENAIAVLYLARGADEESDRKFECFIRSYQHHNAECMHTLYILLKGFASPEHLRTTRERFAPLNPVFVELDDHRYDIGAFIDACAAIRETFVCLLNTHAEILAPCWLRHFMAHLGRNGIGLVGASGSFESLLLPGLDTQMFPNPHLRTNGFALRRSTFLQLFEHYPIGSKLDAYAFESGRVSLTRRIMGRGYGVLVVGRNGRGYPPVWWPASDTFRQGYQSNLLIADNQTRYFANAPAPEKRMLSTLAWGSQIELSDTIPDL